MDQSVYVRAVDRGLVQEGVLGAVLCSLVILVFLGQWRMTVIAILTHAALGAGGDHRPVRDRANDQRDDAGRADAGHRAAWSTAPSSAWKTRTGTWAWATHPSEAAFLRRQRSGHARAGLDAVHVPGAVAVGPDAGHGAVPVPADGAGRGVRDDRGLHPVADVGAVVQRAVAEAARSRRRTRADAARFAGPLPAGKR